MGFPNSEEIKGKYEAAKGALNEDVGHVLDEPEMERQGAAERAAGNARQEAGKIKRKVGEGS